MTRLGFPLMIALLLASPARAGFFDEIVKAVEGSAKDTVTDIAVDMTEKMIKDMFVDYTSGQTRSEEQVSREYEEENGDLPASTIISVYEARILPDTSVSPGTKVYIKSDIEVVVGRDGAASRIEETLHIHHNQDHSVILKSMTKPVGEREGSGGRFYGEFAFTLPEGLPQGVYPIRTTLSMNGELSGDKRFDLQLVMVVEPDGDAALRYASVDN